MTERKLNFSQRYGYTSTSQLQLEYLSEDCKNIIWYILGMCFWREDLLGDLDSESAQKLQPIEQRYVEMVWYEIFNKPFHTLPTRLKDAYKTLWSEYEKFQWFEVFDFLESIFFIAQLNSVFHFNTQSFSTRINSVLKQEGSAYRLVDGYFVPISSEIEINSIVDNLNDNNYLGVQEHIKRALELLKDREKPDYRNSIKESISAVESICQVITGEKDKDLSATLKKLDLHPALKQGYEKLYAYTSNEDGIRHAIFEKEADLKLEEALYFLVSCSAFINYLKAKFPKDN